MTHQVALDSLYLAAQADLVAVTAEMLRSPQAIARQPLAAWYTVSVSEYQSLIEQACGAARQVNRVPREEPSSNRANADPTAASELNDLFHTLHGIAVQLDGDVWSDEYWRLFDGSQACPLNQASYIRRDKGAILGDLAGFYNAFGWRHNPDNGERPDHLLSQLEFVSMLLAMVATAENGEQREIAFEALGEFHRNHMNDWLPSVCNQMEAASELDYFALVSQWLWSFWNTLSTLNGWPSDGQPEPTLSPRIDPEDPYECGAPDVVTLQATASPAIYLDE